MCRNRVYFLCVFIYFITINISSSEIKQYFVDLGRNLTILCPLHNTKDVLWVREGREEMQRNRMTVLNNGALLLLNVQKNDSGIYHCYRENVVESDDAKDDSMEIVVRTPPPALENVVVRPSTIIALIIWEVNGTGGYPITNFTAQYRLHDSSSNEWLAISPNHITPNSRQIDVYRLQPNTTYEFRIWATNQLGRGEITEVIATTSHEYTEKELAQRMLAGAKNFDKRIWAVAVGVVMGTLVLLGMGTCFLLYQECQVSTDVVEEQEIIELVPNIILNPGFDANNSTHNERMPADENSNNETPLRLNNNTIVQQRNV